MNAWTTFLRPLRPTSLALAAAVVALSSGPLSALAEEAAGDHSTLALAAAADPTLTKASAQHVPRKAAVRKAKKPAARDTAAADAKKQATAKQATAKKGSGRKPGAEVAAKDTKPGPLADFGQAEAPDEVVKVANWVSYTHNAKNKAFVVIDKKNARMWVFDRGGKLKSHAPVLLGKAVGDHNAPGVGNKPISQLKDEEKTTPAGRYLVRPGRNTHGHDILWIDYNAAVSMHRVLKVGDEQRFERLASPESSDNRISNGCVNVPIPFYNTVLKPTVMKQGAYVYVLPETTSAQKMFGVVDVAAAAKQG